MVTLQQIDDVLAECEALVPVIGRSPQQERLVVHLMNARGMVRSLGAEATAALERMNGSLDGLRDIATGR